MNQFIITLTGPSQSGKSLVMDKIKRLGEEWKEEQITFQPCKIRKYTTRYLRMEELEILEQGEEADVVYVRNIPQECDLVYQTYGVRYGLETEVLAGKLSAGYWPVVIVNDIRAVEELRKVFSGKVLSLFLFRKIPELDDFKREAQNRGNISEAEVVARYEKAVAIYRTYIENIVLFDKVILNSVEYTAGKERGRDTILDKQLRNVLLPILQGEKTLREKMEYPKKSRIFVIAGNAASGKDEIVRALLSMGKLQAKVLPKYTMRQQEPEDGEEMICRYIPRKSFMEIMEKDFIRQRREIEKNLGRIDGEFTKVYKEEFVRFRQELEEKNLNEYERFWNYISERMAENESQDTILAQYFEENQDYIDLQTIKRNGRKEYEKQGVGIYEINHYYYMIYGKDNKLYGCNISDVKQELRDNRYHLVIVASEMGVVNVLKEKFGEDRVRLIYAHSEISAKEFEENASDITKDEKKKEFQRILENYTNEISNYDHVTIYAKSQLTYERTSKDEELIDQMFRLLRAY